MVIEPDVEPPSLDEDEGGPVKSFLDHLEDLRWVLIKSAVTLSVSMLICLIAGNYVVAIIKRPLEKAQVRYPNDDKIAVLRFGTNRLGTYSLDLDQWDTINSSTNLQNFSTNEIVNLKSLANRLQNPGKDDEISKYLAAQLSVETRNLITNFNEGVARQGILHLYFPKPGEVERMRTVKTDLTQALIRDFNRIIRSGSIFEEQRFAGIKLSAGTARAVGEHPQGADLIRLNRKLLLHAYPHELSSDGQRFVDVQLEPKSDGTNLMLGLVVDKSLDAEAMAKQVKVDLNTLSPAGGFFVAFQVAFYAGVAVASPFLFYFICQFIFPALKWKERRYIFRGLFFFVPLFLMGASFCYFVLMPVALSASQAYSSWLGFSSNIWQAEEYISFVCKFILGMGLGFEMPVVILVLVKLGILNYGILSKGRRYMIVINLVLGALLTTPEVLTQVLMAIPLQLLYEISVWIAWYWERQERKRAAAAAKSGLED